MIEWKTLLDIKELELFLKNKSIAKKKSTGVLSDVRKRLRSK